MRAHAATLDFADRRQMLGFLFGHVARVSPPLGRPAALARAIAGNKTMTGTITDVCEAAMMLGERFGYDSDALGDLGCVYEYWDGSGFPGLAYGEKITEPAQVVQVAALAVAGHRAAGAGWAADLVRQRRGHTLAPAVADAFLADPGSLLKPLAAPDTLWAGVIAAEPAPSGAASPEEIDRVLLAVADFVDLKSPYTLGHARGVADLAAAAADRLALPGTDVGLLRRAALVHGWGRLGVSNSIWDRPGPLGPGELERVRLYPHLTERMLRQSATLAPLGAIAVQCHERLDGSGYPRQLSGAAISLPGRILAAAQTYQTKVEERPHRPALRPPEAAAFLRAEVAHGRLDANAVDAVLAAAGHRRPRTANGPARLTRREIDVLRLLARGLPSREIATRLVISPKTVRNHVEHIYTKIDATNRATASLFALRNGLLGDTDDRPG
jgi:HD-GYP domain-containing protein (c-di-GMP phosphodiesterase class II)